jgi:hypothetical protein
MKFKNTSTGDKSPAYFLVVPSGHTGTATALNAETSKVQIQAISLCYIAAVAKCHCLAVSSYTART